MTPSHLDFLSHTERERERERERGEGNALLDIARIL